MAEQVAQKVLWFVMLIAIFVSIGFLYIKYIIQHDYEILYLNEAERDQFLIENAAEEGTDATDLVPPVAEGTSADVEDTATTTPTDEGVSTQEDVSTSTPEE